MICHFMRLFVCRKNLTIVLLTLLIIHWEMNYSMQCHRQIREIRSVRIFSCGSVALDLDPCGPLAVGTVSRQAKHYLSFCRDNVEWPPVLSLSSREVGSVFWNPRVCTTCAWTPDSILYAQELLIPWWGAFFLKTLNDWMARSPLWRFWSASQ